MIVVTLTKVPPSLRGDLTKWYQEIQTGVYVGNVSAKVREELWQRILRDLGNGQATMAYNANNELGYQFKTTRKDFEIENFDGIPLVRRLLSVDQPVKSGYSDAAKWHRAKLFNSTKPHKPANNISKYVAVDLETTGLDVTKDAILSIGAVKKNSSGQFDRLDIFVKTNRQIPEKITKLTGISKQLILSDGIELNQALNQFQEFVGHLPIVGYNLRFDDEFISAALRKLNRPLMANHLIDLMLIVKKTNKYLDNYQLRTVLEHYAVVNSRPHHALSDASATFALATKLMENGKLTI